MKFDLITLLRERKIVRPMRFASAFITGDRTLRIRSSGYPWWSEAADKQRDHEIEFIFRELGVGSIDLETLHSSDDAFLELIDVVETESLSWAQAQGFEIYCGAPLARPLDLYQKVHDFLVREQSLWYADRFLNGARTLDQFVELTGSRSYLLAAVPRALRDVINDELDAQGVRHNELPKAMGQSHRLFVTIEASQFFCTSAEAEFAD